MSFMSGSLEGVSIPWQKVMPARAHQSFVKGLVDQVVVAIDGTPQDYYRAVWVPGTQVLNALRPGFIDKGRWQELMAAGEGNVAAIRSFEPDARGFAQPVVYDRFKILTGRLTVQGGPQIHTLKREHRNLIKSMYGKDGAVYAMDFSNLEARILLYEYNKHCPDPDLYGALAKELGYDRTAVKGAVISELYGSSVWALGKHLGIEGKELYDFVKRVKDHFNTGELLTRVKAQFVATGKVINRYGRPITIDEPLDHIFISYYAQSTGADVTMLGFKQVLDKVTEKAPRIRPIYLIHDSIIFDLPKEDLQHLQLIKHIKVKGYVQKFPFKLEKIS